MPNKKVFLAYTQNNAVAYIRMIQYAKYMRRINGMEIAYSNWQPYDDKVIRWWDELMTNPVILKQVEGLAKEADITVFGAMFNLKAVALVPALQCKYDKPIFMEMDDYIFNLPGYNIASKSFRPNNMNEFALINQLRVSDGLIVSTKWLKEQFSKFNSNIHIVPNGVDFEAWGLVNKNGGDRIKIGFEGSPNHSGDLRLLKKAFIVILEKYPNVEIVSMGCPIPFMEHERIKVLDDFIPIPDYPRALADQGFDIGIAPLKDNFFNRGKSNLRYLEMSALKIPTVASLCNSYKDDIKNGENGYLCTSDDEWIDSLSELIENESKRKAIGQNAYDYVKKNYDLKNISNDYCKILQEAKRGLNEQVGITVGSKTSN